jgi:(2Fe-2S) ferredoxin
LSYYVRHLFFCVNQREDGSRCCANFNSQKMRDYAKARLKKMHLSGQGKCRTNTAGCLDRCDQGPVLVVYPEAVWYTYVDEQDIDEIIEEHIVHGRVVKRLKI